MSMKPKKLESRNLPELKPFPGHEHYHGLLSKEKLAALADNIKTTGLKHPIEVLPSNIAGFKIDTILHGHNRRAALGLLGLKKAEVLVRYDLAEASKCVIKLDFLGENHNRGKEDPLTQARIAVEMLELERQRDGGRVTSGEARDRVGKVLGMSGRNLDRYLRVLTTPIAVQKAFSAGKITLIDAGKIAGLKENLRLEIATRIEKGDNPRQVVKEFLAGSTTACETLDAFTKRFVEHPKKLERVLTGSVYPVTVNELSKLDAACREMQSVIAKYRKK